MMHCAGGLGSCQIRRWILRGLVTCRDSSKRISNVRVACVRMQTRRDARLKKMHLMFAFILVIMYHLHHRPREGQ